VNQKTLLPPGRRRRRPGLTQRPERFFGWLAAGLVVAVSTAWILGLWEAVRAADRPERTRSSPGQAVSSALLEPRSQKLAYLSDSDVDFIDVLRGRSGKLRAAFKTPGQPVIDEPAEEASAHYEAEGGTPVISPDFKAPRQPGVYTLAVELNKAQRAIDDLRIITLVPFDRKEKGRIGLYYLGNWPFEGGGRPPSSAYGNPDGFVEVTRENRSLPVSEHFKLGDFLTKDQPDVWPKYVLLDPRLLDKLELVIDELTREGYDVRHLTVMSGFRTPRYNKGGGNTGGRANLSRHMYGDASDVFVDNDRDGWTDDVNRDGRVDVKDSEVVARAAERVEAGTPALVGGIGIYQACCGHGPFTHVDVRGRRARWRGTGKG
jgi:uncharacterized protein YcbK (DUF882 family)